MDAGAVHDTVDDVSSPEVAITDFGAPGVVAVAETGATGFDAVEGTPLPILLVATTMKV